MSDNYSEHLGNGITCIDAGYIRPGMACFYLLRQGDECAIIDTGISHSVVHLEQVMTTQGISPEQVRYIIPTHIHLDHAGGAGTMMRRFDQAQLLVHPRGARHLVDPERLLASTQSVYGVDRFRELYGEIVPVEADRVVPVADGEIFRVNGRALEIRHTRGHADHHVCVWDEYSRGWFSGDMFGISYHWFRFPAGSFVMPATTPTQFDPEQYLLSIDLLESYRPQRIYLTHYGELEYSGELAALLARQVHEYPRLLGELAGDHTAMRNAICDYSIGLLRRFDTGLEKNELEELLAFDIDLNARGVALWLQSQLKETLS
ncbi:MAG: MBL fold metallo-hydrolase [Gammaproteobacteria bacterium]|nr:MBL fold metallo-hydrolase [Gammaproteobacteria bacterium]MDH5172967.1 MBL fold metallo-hydrolase [Gammaproteobacteria bacterium]